MPSPFPGMDPFIENQKWEDFHTRFLTAVSDALVSSVRPFYTVEVERRIYFAAHLSPPAGHGVEVRCRLPIRRVCKIVSLNRRNIFAQPCSSVAAERRVLGKTLQSRQ